MSLSHGIIFSSSVKLYFGFEVDDLEDLNIVKSLMKDINLFNKR